MKRILYTLMVMLMTLSLVGCGDTSASKPDDSMGNNTVQNSADQQTQGEEGTETENTSADTQGVDTSGKADTSSYDVDLTTLSSTMVYSEVYNMISEPEQYTGKSIRMNGQFSCFQMTDAEGKPIPDQTYFSCIISDATACCSQGLEFVLAGEHTYPDDYPVPGDDIVVSGTFETYYEDGYLYCHLINAEFE